MQQRGILDGNEYTSDFLSCTRRIRRLCSPANTTAELGSLAEAALLACASDCSLLRLVALEVQWRHPQAAVSFETNQRMMCVSGILPVRRCAVKILTKILATPP